ncbi:hypothetical protein FB451DRAFT_1395600 [Mycena latifolia]|nr:hypothetical protein FB451DRAFT_1395600 [Mycena latifolia]
MGGAPALESPFEPSSNNPVPYAYDTCHSHRARIELAHRFPALISGFKASNWLYGIDASSIPRSAGVLLVPRSSLLGMHCVRLPPSVRLRAAQGTSKPRTTFEFGPRGPMQSTPLTSSSSLSPWCWWQPGASFLFHCPHALEFSWRTVLATASDEQPSTVLDAVSTATMYWAAALTVHTAGTGMRRYSKPWAHRSSSAPVTARITALQRDTSLRWDDSHRQIYIGIHLRITSLITLT